MKKYKLIFSFFIVITIIFALRFASEDLIETVTQLFDSRKIILLYTTWNLEAYWNDLDPTKLPNYFEKCAIKSCVITYDREKLRKASAVLFHAQDLGSDELYSVENLLDIKGRNDDQIWIWVNQESPLNIKDLKQYNGIFNWTATYHRDSDIFMPYFYYEKLKKDVEIDYNDIMRNKKKSVAWMVSDCGGLREKYVLKLQKYINVTVYGSCKDRYKLKGEYCVKNTMDCWKELSQYKYYLAFENSICEDYITEKYWENALLHNMVPVVMGANYDKMVAIPGSYIDVANFRSVKELASFLKYLDKNEKEYLKYFDWKKMYKVNGGTDLFCEICKRLHFSKLPKKVHHNLEDFWSREKMCFAYQRKIH